MVNSLLHLKQIGFLRSATSLIQIIGRAARNQNGRVVMYADSESPAMKEAIAETKRRRQIQQAFNEKHGITPQTVRKAIEDILSRKIEEKKEVVATELSVFKETYNVFNKSDRTKLIKAMEKQMMEHAERLEFEEAAAIRDEIEQLKKQFT